MTAPSDHQRILLCRPASGLNDNLSQIGAACRHGERFGRKVIVETDFALGSFGVSWGMIARRRVRT